MHKCQTSKDMRLWKHRNLERLGGSFNTDAGENKPCFSAELELQVQYIFYVSYFTLDKILFCCPVLSWAHDAPEQLGFQAFTSLPGFCLFLGYPICSRSMAYLLTLIIKQWMLSFRLVEWESLQTPQLIVMCYSSTAQGLLGYSTTWVIWFPNSHLFWYEQIQLYLGDVSSTV